VVNIRRVKGRFDYLGGVLESGLGGELLDKVVEDNVGPAQLVAHQVLATRLLLCMIIRSLPKLCPWRRKKIRIARWILEI
jgi:hypothetical protein